MPLRTPDKASTGIAGLDQLLNAALPAHEVYLVTGEPGTGQPTLAHQLLLAGLQAGERCLYITLSQTAEGLRKVARRRVACACCPDCVACSPRPTASTGARARSAKRGK